MPAAKRTPLAHRLKQQAVAYLAAKAMGCYELVPFHSKGQPYFLLQCDGCEQIACETRSFAAPIKLCGVCSGCHWAFVHRAGPFLASFHPQTVLDIIWHLLVRVCDVSLISIVLLTFICVL